MEKPLHAIWSPSKNETAKKDKKTKKRQRGNLEHLTNQAW